MRLSLLLTFLLLSSSSLLAQQGSDLYQRYQEQFMRVDHRSRIRMEEFNLPVLGAQTPQLNYTRVYDLLLIYADGRPAKQYQFSFASAEQRFGDLLNPDIDLRVMEAGTMLRLDKRDLAYMVLDDIVFVCDTNRKSAYTGHWGLLGVNGPLRIIRWFHFWRNSGEITEQREVFMGDKQVLQYTGWKEEMTTLMADYPALVEKINNREEGYRRDDESRIIMEYNRYVREQDPERFYEAAMPAPLLVNPTILSAAAAPGRTQLLETIDFKAQEENWLVETPFSSPNRMFNADSLYDLHVVYRDGSSEDLLFSPEPRPWLRKEGLPYYAGQFLFMYEYTTIPVIRDGTYEALDKEAIAWYILDNRFIIVHRSVVPGASETLAWGLLLMQGPFTQVKWYYSYDGRVAYDTRTYLFGERQKSNYLDAQGGWKKAFAERLSDHPYITEKINNKAPGYKSPRDARPTAIEYNEWLRNTNPTRFEEFMITKE